MKKIRFINKVGIGVETKRGLRRTTLLYCGILLVVIELITLWMEGWKSADFPLKFILPIVFIIIGKEKEYKQVLIGTETCVTISTEKLIIEYPQICCDAELSPSSELYEYRVGDICKYQYRKEEGSVLISGTPLVTITYANGQKREYDSRERKYLEDVFLYMKEDELAEFQEEMLRTYNLSLEIV